MDVGKFLISIGVTPNTKGFYYLIRAIELYTQNPSTKLCEAHRIIAKEKNTTKKGVEKAMAYALSMVNTNSEIYKQYVPLNRRDVSVTEFISIIAYLIRREESKE